MCVCIGTGVSITSAMKCQYVGVHVRRGDFKQAKLVEAGFVLAKKQFTERAMTYYCRRLGTSVRLTFIVCGDDLAWNRKYVTLPVACRGQGHSVAHCLLSTPPVHMALLSSCHHSIVTSGSFGWWAAYLAGGVVVYDKSFPRPGTLIGQRYSPTDYYPAAWIPL
jgi:galactoside 2-L-fucosyltransferase 1/2